MSLDQYRNSAVRLPNFPVIWYKWCKATAPNKKTRLQWTWPLFYFLGQAISCVQKVFSLYIRILIGIGGKVFFEYPITIVHLYVKWGMKLPVYRVREIQWQNTKLYWGIKSYTIFQNWLSYLFWEKIILKFVKQLGN